MTGILASTLLRFRSIKSSTGKSSTGRTTRRNLRKARRSHVRRLLGEPLEQRRVLAAYLVTTADDVSDENDGMLSLREAIQAANTNAIINADTIAGDAGPAITDTISFTDGLSSIILGSELSMTDSLSISPGAASSQIISGNDASRIFSIDNGESDSATSVSIEGLTLSDGFANRVGGGIEATDATLDDLESENNGQGGGIELLSANI